MREHDGTQVLPSLTIKNMGPHRFWWWRDQIMHERPHQHNYEPARRGDKDQSCLMLANAVFGEL